VTFANDLFRSGKPDPDPGHWLNVRVGDNVRIGSGAPLLTDALCSGAVIGAGSVVEKPVTVKGTYAGNPSLLIRTLL